MNFHVKGRAIVFALLVSICNFGTAYAHSLPGTVLIFSRDGAELKATIEVALEDLVIAFPEIASLEDKPSLGGLSSADLAQLRAYFSQHIALQSNSVDLQVSLSHARLRQAENDHVGEFVQMVADLTVALPLSDQTPPLVLFYDAVMHEVRSHSATVYWRDSTDDLRALAEFRYNAIDGARQPILLEFQ